MALNSKEMDRVVAGWKPGDIVEIENHPIGRRWIVTKLHYDFKNAGLKCPACKHTPAGMPWVGWFHCRRCNATSLVKSGKVLIPVKDVCNGVK